MNNELDEIFDAFENKDVKSLTNNKVFVSFLKYYYNIDHLYFNKDYQYNNIIVCED
jgi:hypothetical protein